MAEQLDPPLKLPGKLSLKRLVQLLEKCGIDPSPGQTPSAKPDFSREYALIDQRLGLLRNELRRALRLHYAAQARWAWVRRQRGKITRDWLAKIQAVMRPGEWYTIMDVLTRVWGAFGGMEGIKRPSECCRSQLETYVAKGKLRKVRNPEWGKWRPLEQKARPVKWLYGLPAHEGTGKPQESRIT